MREPKIRELSRELGKRLDPRFRGDERGDSTSAHLALAQASSVLSVAIRPEALWVTLPVASFCCTHVSVRSSLLTPWAIVLVCGANTKYPVKAMAANA